MSDVIVIFKVMPSGVETDLVKLEKDIREAVNPQRIEKEPVAFGLVALNVTTLMEDAEGKLDQVESKLRAIENVSDVQVTEITRTI